MLTDQIDRLHYFLNRSLGSMDRVKACCRNRPALAPGTSVINICPGCDKRYREMYADCSTVSLWEILADSDFSFPDYAGCVMTIENEPARTAVKTDG